MKIVSIATKLPNRIVTNDEIASFLDTSNEWITLKTGIKTRHIVSHDNLTELATDASCTALKKANLSATDIDMLICATSTADNAMPSLACSIIERIGARCPGFDVNAACTGFIYALDTADAFIRAGKVKTILLVAAERMSRLLDWKDRSTCILFGDGTSACVVTAGDALKYIRTTVNPNEALLYAKSLGENNPFTKESRASSYLKMQGQQVYKFAIRSIEEEIRCVFDTLNMCDADVDYYILHQANMRIIEGASARLKLPLEKFPFNIDKYGNMSAASIPVVLDEMIEKGCIKSGSLIVMVGFGAGMTVGTAVMVWQ